MRLHNQLQYRRGTAALPTGRQVAGARVPNGAQGAQPRGAGGRHTPHAGERPRRGPEACTHIRRTFSRARKKRASWPFSMSLCVGLDQEILTLHKTAAFIARHSFAHYFTPPNNLPN